MCISREPVGAATAVGTMTIRVTIAETCSIVSGTTTLDFGTQTLLNSNVDASATIQIQCTSGTDYDVSLDTGLNGSRRMRLAATNSYISYELYTNAARTIAWPSVAGTAPYSYVGNGSAQSIVIYGRIPSQPTPEASGTAYTDTIGITITY